MPAQGPRRRRRNKYVWMMVDRDFRENVILPLLSMFAMVDDVFTEDDALSDPNKVKIGMGRIYEEWKRCRMKLEPGFEPVSGERPKKWLPKKKTTQAATGHRARG